MTTTTSFATLTDYGCLYKSGIYALTDFLAFRDPPLPSHAPLPGKLPDQGKKS